MPDFEPGPFPASDESSDPDSTGSDSSQADTQVIVAIEKANHHAQCTTACVVLTDSRHHRLSMKELSLWGMMIVC